MSDVELVERADGVLVDRRYRVVGHSFHCLSGKCHECRGAALWQTLDGLRWLRLVSPATGQRQGGERE